MQAIENFLFELGRLDIQVWIDDDKLRCNAPKDSLTAELRDQLSERKAEIIDFLNKKAIFDQSIPRLDDNTPPLISLAQQRLWFLQQLEGQSATYNMPTALLLSGQLDVAALQRSLLWLIERHDSLRSCFPTVDGQAQIQILEAIEFLPIHDLRHFSAEQQQAKVQQHVSQHALATFDLSTGPLFKADLLLLSDEQSMLLLNMHHIISDGWSWGVLMRDWQQAYIACSTGKQPELPPLAIQYSDYATWQRTWLQGDLLQQQRDYWQQQLADAPALLELPTDKPRPAQKSHAGAHHAFTLSPELSDKLAQLSQQQGVSLFMTLLSAFYILLSRYSRQEDICVGSPVANRPHEQTEDLIGFFINMLVLRGQLQPQHSFLALLEQTRETCLSAYRHQDIPFEMLVEQLQPTRSTSHTPLFQVVFVMQNQEAAELQLPGLTVTALPDEFPVAKFDLTLAIEERKGQLHGMLEYATDLFAATTIANMAGHFTTLLEAIVDNPDRAICNLPILTAAETQQLHNWNATATDYPTNTTVTDLFEQQVLKTPDHDAVRFAGAALTYQQLNQQANQLAHHLWAQLKQANIPDPNPLIAIAVERSADMVVGLLSILKIGAAYVPIDPSYPAARIQHMLADSAAPLLLTQSHLQAKLPLADLPHACATICVDNIDVTGLMTENPLVNRQADDLAYVIYTSGSTGTPKGVMVEHQGLVNMCCWHNEVFGVDAQDTATLLANNAFDASVLELWPYLLAGACVVPAQLETLMEAGFWSWFNEQGITMSFLPTPLVNDYAETTVPTTQLRYVLTGGDTLQAYPEHFPCPLSNNYGPTENTVVATSTVLSADGVVNIGKPVANTRVYILDGQQQPLPIGLSGELVIAGAGVARGYLNRPELTAEKFVELELFGQTERVYKTGDLACWRADGSIEFMGRIDAQVKLRGFRIELGEIETVITQHQAVKAAVVNLNESNGDQQLAAYLVTEAAATAQFITELKTWLATRLPDYMLPSHFQILDALPLTPNGKIDRKALSINANTTSQEPEVVIKPQTTLEQQIAEIWQTVLQREQVSVHDNFFDLGGHSLRMMQVHSRLQALLDETLPVVTLFQYPTIHGLAAYLADDEPQILPSTRPQAAATANTETADIAIVGLAGRFPGAANVEAFWDNLRNGVESISFFSDAELIANGIDPTVVRQPNYVKANGVLDKADYFDAQFFGYTPRQADFLDPQQRLFLQTAWTALEQAGYSAPDIDGRVGVFAGAAPSTYLHNNILPNQAQLANFSDVDLGLAERDFIATNAAYKLNLTGPAMFIHTACSTSLVAVHLARQSLLNNECEMALAGGVSVGFPQQRGYEYEEDMIMSPDGHCRAFDAEGKGAVGGAGVGVVVLKRLQQALADGDTIHAVIKNSAVNNDGMDKVGFTAPSVHGQASAIHDAMVGLDYESVSYIETHGTATMLGDPIEISALTQAYRQQTDKTGYCALGSVKTNVGHLNTAAGVTSLIKTVLALKHREIPPSLHFQQPNPQIDFANSPFFVNTELTPWQSDTPRRAGVSSFGIGGTNAHVVLEQAPEQRSTPSSRPQLICVSAKTETAMQQACDNLADYLTEHPQVDLADVAYTLNQGRHSFAYRGFVLGNDTADVATVLRERDPKQWRTLKAANNAAKVVLMFSGQGTQYANMTLGLYQTESVFRETVDQCAELLKPLMGQDIRDLLYPPAGAQPDLKPSGIAQPILFTVEYALAKLCLHWGLQPTAMIGHSIGEYVAACIAGVFSLADGLELVAVRGRLMQNLPAGEMLSIMAAKAEVEPLLTEGLCIGAHNAPQFCTVSGNAEAISALSSTLQSQRIMHSRVHTANAAHSPMMLPMLDALRAQFNQITLQPPQIPYISNFTGTWVTAQQATSVDAWCDHALHTVLFSEGLQTLLAEDDYILLEIGPEMTLTSFALQHQQQYRVSAFNLLRTAVSTQTDEVWLLNILGQLWLRNVRFDWQAFYQHEQRLRIPLPTYPFEEQRHWIDPPPAPVAQAAAPVAQAVVQPTTEAQLLAAPPVRTPATTPDAKPTVQPGSRVTLRQHDRPSLATEYVVPSSALEQQVAELWEALLGFAPIGRYDNFFELGANSLLGIQLLARLREDLGFEIPLKILFERPVLQDFTSWLSEQQPQADLMLPTIIPLAADAPRHLSSAQQRLWFLAQLEGASANTYNLTDAIHFSGHLDVAALQQSLRWVVQRHESLRTCFPVDEDGQASLQVVSAETVDALTIRDLCHLQIDADGEEIQRLAYEHAIQPFDLTQAPLFKADLLLLSERDSVLLLNTHHIISDGWSIGLFNRDWLHAYSAIVQGGQPSMPPLEIQYSDYAAAQRSWLQGEVLDKQLAYWQQQLAGAPELLELPTDKPRPPRQSYRGAHYYGSLSPELTRGFLQLGKQHNVTLLMSLYSVLFVLLARYTRQNDICLGSPAANRNYHSQIEDLMGFFVNSLVIREQVQPEQGFLDFLYSVRDTCLEAYANQDVPFETLVDQLNIPRSLSYNPLIQTMVGLADNFVSDLDLADLESRELLVNYSPTAKFDLLVYFAERDGKLLYVWEYATDLFEEATIARFCEHFEALIAAVVADPTQPIAQLSMLTAAEQTQLQAWNQTAETYPSEQTLVSLFERHAAQSPQTVAVVCGDQQIDYQRLNARANQVAHALIKANTNSGNVKAQQTTLVAITVDRSIDMLVGVLGILKAGCAYIPIDPSYPSARIAHMLNDSAAPLLLTQSHLQAQLPTNTFVHHCSMLCLDSDVFAEHSTHNPSLLSKPDDLAYVIYTSGSTGQPKGVMIEHRSVVNHLHGFELQAPHTQPLSGIFSVPFSFDLSVWEIFSQLCYGGTLHVLEQKAMLDAELLTNYLLAQRISSAYIPPALLELVASGFAANRDNPLQRLLVGVEPIAQSVLQQFRALSKTLHIINGYGPTEATVCATFYPFTQALEPERRTPIGQPPANYRVYILDSHQQLQPIGVAGELCIAGDSLARGYLNRSELTAERFVEVNLFGKTERVYKTGDLARWLADGNIEYLGRFDHQVKLRGFRIELGEIEAILAQHYAVQETAAMLFDNDGHQQLVAYVTLDNTTAITATDDLMAELKAWLKIRLPDYMIPSQVMVLDQLPLMPNGKLDRKALPEPQHDVTVAYAAPRNALEQQLAEIWAAVLKHPEPSIHANFFELGGDSILSIQIIARARQLGLQLSAQHVFEYQTIAELATVVQVGVETQAEQGMVTGNMPLTPIQRWFFAQDYPESWHFNLSLLFSVPADINVGALRQAFSTVLAHHDALRLRYIEKNSAWQQSFSAFSASLPFAVEDLNAAQDPQQALLDVTQRYQASLKLADGPLTSLVLLRWQGEARLFWCLHHLVVDGVSLRILQEDLQTVYQQIVTGHRPQLPAKTSSFKAWVEHLVRYSQGEALAAELDYWRALPTQSLPVDKPHGSRALSHAEECTFQLTAAETTALLTKVPAAYDTQINAVLLTALALSLADWTEQETCVIDLEGHGRVDLFAELDVSRTVGWFTTVFPVALTLPSCVDSKIDLGAALQAIQQQLQAVPKDGIGYGLLRHWQGEDLPQGDIVFNYLGQFEAGTSDGVLKPTDETYGDNVSRQSEQSHLIDVNGAVMQGQLYFNWRYSSECYEAATIQALVDAYQKHLRRIIAHCTGGNDVPPPKSPTAMSLHRGTESSTEIVGWADEGSPSIAVNEKLAAVSPSIKTAVLEQLDSRYPNWEDAYPLSPLQQGLLFHSLYEPETGAYFQQLHWTLSKLDPAAFKAAWALQLQRHPILRSVFVTDSEPLLQVVLADAALQWREHDWRELSPAAQQSQFETLLEQERQQGFALSEKPVWRCDLIRLDAERYRFVHHHHHMLIDGWCLPLIFSEVIQSYLANLHGQTPQLPAIRPYGDYILWLQQQDTATAQHYWQQRLIDFSAPTPLSFMIQTTAAPAYRECEYHLDTASTQQLQQFQKAHHVTLNTLVQGAWALLLSRYSRESSVCFGVTVSGRHIPLDGIEEMVGLFINTLPLRVDVYPQESVSEYLQHLQSQHQNDTQYAHMPLFEIQNLSEVANGTALFDSVLIFENYPLDAVAELPAECFVIEAGSSVERANYPLALIVVPEATGLTVRVSYDSQRISDAAVAQIWQHFAQLLVALVEQPTLPVSQLSLLNATEVAQLQAWNATTTDYAEQAGLGTPQTVLDLFAHQVATVPNHAAVAVAGESLTYAELNTQADQIAHALRQHPAFPSGRNPLIAIALERSLELITSLLGVLKAGAAYVPIDPDYPKARIDHILADTATPILLTHSQLKSQLPSTESTSVMCIDEMTLSNQAMPPLDIASDDLAYVIYTSGSTGLPKGTMVTHRSVLNSTQARYHHYQPNEAMRLLTLPSFSFDAFGAGAYFALCYGGCLHLPTDTNDIDQLADTIIAEQITDLTIVPALYQALLEHHAKPYAALQRVIMGGEVASPALLAQHFSQAKQVGLFNEYGPTEATIWCAVFQYQSADAALNTIGRPIANTRIYILDAQQQPQPIGVAGELCIAGAGLARGYLNRPELTAEKFIEVELLGQRERIYKTGDLARWSSAGQLEYLGRIDQQVKLRGFRIELGEIEAALTQHEAVQTAIVTLNDDADQLIAYLFTSQDGSHHSHDAVTTELKTWLAERLPDYMRPRHFVILDQLPLTPNGKIDRKALPQPAALQSNTAQFTSPQTALERDIAKVWQDLLKVDQVGLHDNFFDLGGHSILAIQAQNRLRTALEMDVPVVKLFQYPTVASLAAHLAGDASQTALKVPPSPATHNDEIAIIGMAGRFPAADNLDTFWQNLRDGVECIRFFSDEELLANGTPKELLDQPNFVKAGGILDDVDLFDAAFFGFAPTEAEILDPQQRIFLEAAWASLEQAGYDASNIDHPVGVFAGVNSSTYLSNHLFSNPAVKVGHFEVMLGNEKDFFATRAAHKLNLIGPAFTVQTACSTSLVAVHLASQSLLNGECEMALAGGAALGFPQKRGYLYEKGMTTSPDGHCRAFDAAAQGTVGGEGVGIVVLKRLSRALADGDTIHAVIKGSAINNDGQHKAGYTAPSVDGQAAAIHQAMQGLDYESISYVETHGTATVLGDPIEISALNQAYRHHTEKNHYCALGAVKTNIGHLDSAAGIAGLMKTVLALKHREIPPSLHFQQPNPEIDFDNSPFFVNTTLQAWESTTPRRAGVSSFGIGGTNAHVVLEEAPTQQTASTQGGQLLCLSARTESALAQACDNLADHLAANPDLNLADVAYTLNVGRKAFPQRGFILAETVAEAVEKLRQRAPTVWRHRQSDDKTPPLAFMFPGQGAQYAKMAQGLYRSEAVFRETVDDCAALLQPHLGADIRDWLYGEQVDLQPPQIAQPSLFVTEYALAQCCLSWGLQPAAMIGHSLGEYVTACLAGVFSLADALALIAVRGQLMQTLPSGEMLTVLLPPEQVEPLLNEHLFLAAHNAPNLSVVSGSSTAIQALTEQLLEQHVPHSRLATSAAAHSPLLLPMLKAFRQQLEQTPRQPPQRRYISNLTGTWITAEQATSVDYWCEHLLHSVQFSTGLQTLLAEEDYLLLEVGPEMTLTSFALQQQPQYRVTAFNLLRTAKTTQDDATWLRNHLGQLWLHNVPVDWTAFYANQARLRLPLPTYPFERQRYWIEPANDKNLATPNASPERVKRPLAEWFYAPHWQPTLAADLQPQITELTASCWLIFIDEHGLGTAMAAALSEQGAEIITVQHGSRFTQQTEQSYSLNPQQRDDYQHLFSALQKNAVLPTAVLHLWSLDSGTDLAQSQIYSFYSLLYLTQTWSKPDQDRHLIVVSDQIHAVTGAETLQPLAATLIGPVKIIGAEYPDIHCRNLDIVLPTTAADKQAVLDSLLSECRVSSTEQLIAYRNQRRWAIHYEAVNFSVAKPKTLPKNLNLRQQGVYLITGGLGGIGLAIAAYLAETVQAKLILTSRSTFPEMSTWDTWLDTHAADDATSVKIQQLRALQAAGAELVICHADVSDREAMQPVLQQAQAQFGHLHGVIHAAGLPAGGVIELKTPSEVERIFAPKLQGSLVLHELLAETNPPLDFLVLFSSLGSLLELPGQVDYCAANAFLDAYAHHLRAQGINAISINWDAWQVGMSVNSNILDDMQTTHLENIQTYGIAPHEGTDALAQILSHQLPQVVVSTVDFQQQMQWQKTENAKQFEQLELDNTSTPQYQRPALTNDYVAPRDETEHKIAQIWQALLGIEQIGVYDNFFELGGHSLVAVHVMAKTEQHFGQTLPLALLLENPTIAQFAPLLTQQQAAWSPLVALQTQGEKPPLFCIHPAGGDVLCYAELAKQLGNQQPLYALQAFGLEAGQTPYTQLVEMASLYIEALKTRQPQGPYYLSGWSFGGLTAFEMARQLQAQGETIALLLLFDTATPAIATRLHKPQDDAELLVDIFHHDVPNLSAAHLRQLSEDEQLGHIVEQVKEKDLMLAEMNVEQLKRTLNVCKVNMNAFQYYQPQPYQGQIVLFEVQEHRDDMRIDEPDYGWGEYVTEGVEVVSVPGDHQTLFRMPHLETLAEVLGGYLA